MAISSINNGDSGSAVRTILNSVITAVNDLGTPTPTGLALLQAADAATGRTALSLGTIATQAANSVSLTGGTITGLTQLGMTGGTNPTASTLGLGTITDTTARPLQVTQTWNNSSLAATAMKVAVTDTSSATASYLLDLQVGGSTKFNVTKAGIVNVGSNVVAGAVTLLYGSGLSATGNLVLAATGGDVGFTSNNGGKYAWGFRSGTLNFHGASDAKMAWTDTAAATNNNGIDGTASLILGRAAAATLQLGLDSASTPTAQTIKSHNVTTGTGADITIAGGTGSVAGGAVKLATSATTGAPTTILTVKASGVVNIANLPTSSSGLATGDLYQTAGALMVA